MQHHVVFEGFNNNDIRQPYLNQCGALLNKYLLVSEIIAQGLALVLDNLVDSLAEAYFETDIDGGWWFNLRGIAKDILKRSGIKDENIIDINYCTYHNDDLFYSYRREGDNTGRMLAVIYKER